MRRKEEAKITFIFLRLTISISHDCPAQAKCFPFGRSAIVVGLQEATFSDEARHVPSAKLQIQIDPSIETEELIH